MSDPAPPVAGDPLADLRDIHLPAEPSWWPPAPGWWGLAVVTVALAAWAAVAIVRRHRAHAPRRAALRELDALEARAAAGEASTRTLADVSGLLRRFALAWFPGEAVAGHTGRVWLEFLDRHGGDGAFTDGPGACLADAPYRAEASVDPGPVITLVRRWIRRCEHRRPC